MSPEGYCSLQTAHKIQPTALLPIHVRQTRCPQGILYLTIPLSNTTVLHVTHLVCLLERLKSSGTVDLIEEGPHEKEGRPPNADERAESRLELRSLVWSDLLPGRSVDCIAVVLLI